MNYLRLVRFPNLLIVALTQFLLQYLLLRPAFAQASISAALDLPHFTLLVISTLLIAAGGYVINDLTDYAIDVVNKPQQVIINRLIPAKTAWRFYFSLFLIGFTISLYLAWHVDNLPLVLLYPTAVALLHAYSVRLKATVLWGNIVVSIFCAFVAGIVLFAERHTIQEMYQSQTAIAEELMLLSLAYMFFAFVATMFRELVKDIEDVEGDREKGCRTLPVVFGTSKAKWVAGFFGLLLLESIRRWAVLLWQEEQWIPLVFLLLGIALPILLALYRLVQAQEKSQFHFLSQFTKYIILSGILYLIVWRLFGV